MKKILFILFFSPSVAFSSGIFNPGSGGGGGGSGVTVYPATSSIIVNGNIELDQQNSTIADPAVIQSTFTANAAFVNQMGAIIHARLPSTSVQSYFELSASTYPYYSNPSGGAKIQLFNSNGAGSLLRFLIGGSSIFESDGTTMNHYIKQDYYDGALTNFVEERSSATVGSSFAIVRPSVAGTAGQVRTISNVVGTDVYEDWETPSGGGGGVSVYPATSTVNLAVGAIISTMAVGGGGTVAPAATFQSNSPSSSPNAVVRIKAPLGFNRSALTLYNSSGFNASNRTKLQFSGNNSGDSEIQWPYIQAGSHVTEFADQSNGIWLSVDSSQVDTVLNFETGSNVNFCFDGDTPSHVGSHCLEYNQTNQEFKVWPQLRTLYKVFIDSDVVFGSSMTLVHQNPGVLLLAPNTSNFITINGTDGQYTRMVNGTPKFSTILSTDVSGVAILTATQTFSGQNTFTATTTFTSTVTATGMSAFIFGQATLISTSNVFQIGTSTTMALTNVGHLEFHSSISPTVSSCGSGPSVTSGSSDTTGSLTMGSLTVGCTLTFSQPFQNIPQCFVNDETTVSAVRVVPTKTNMVITTAGTGGDLVDYFCVGDQ